MTNHKNLLLKMSLSCLVALMTIATLGPPSQAQSASEIRQAMAGHWRSTEINGGQPTDENLVLNANGTFQNWTVIPGARSDTTSGSWRTEGKSLIIRQANGAESSIPFTFHDGKLVLPNIPGQRAFFERVR